MTQRFAMKSLCLIVYICVIRSVVAAKVQEFAFNKHNQNKSLGISTSSAAKKHQIVTNEAAVQISIIAHFRARVHETG